MKGINKVIILGTLGRDPEIKYTASGTAIATLSVATSESWIDKQTKEKTEKTEWHRVVAFARLAEIMGEFLSKGSQVYIEGKLQTRKWQDQSGADRYTTEVVARDMQMLGGKKPAGSAPQSSGFRKPADKQPEEKKPNKPVTAADFEDDDIPF